VACSFGFRGFLGVFADAKIPTKFADCSFSILGFKQANFEIEGALRLTAPAALLTANRKY